MFAWWCSHCDQVLQDYARLKQNERPYMVAVFQKGTNDKQYIEQKLNANGIKGEYYIYYETPPIESIPMLVWWSEDKIQNASPVQGEQELLGMARIEIENSGSGHNAKLAASFINDSVIFPGEIFSFNETVGERTPEKGYKNGLIITNNSEGFEYSEGIGGGICKTATVLNWAVENAGLKVLEQHPHSLPVAYGKERPDTAVAWPSLDYRFRNDTNQKIEIKTKTVGEWLEIEIWSN